LPAGGEPAGPRDCCRLVRRLDARRYYSPGAAVEQPPDRAVLCFRYPGEREQSQVAGGPGQVRGHVEGHRRVLEVDQDGVVTGGLRDPDDVRGTAAADGEHQVRLTVPQPVQEGAHRAPASAE
jgi:hypothetical protein